jgi:hypothetical protein
MRVRSLSLQAPDFETASRSQASGMWQQAGHQ